MKFLITLILSVLIVTPALAKMEKDKSSGNISITNVWAKPNYGPNGAVYLTIKNNDKTKRHLIDATTPEAGRVEIHRHDHVNGVMQMRHVKEGIELAKGQEVTFAPSGYHIMLFKMPNKFKLGDSFPLSLQFKDGTIQKMTVKIMTNLK